MTHDAQVHQAREQTKAVTARFGDDYWREADLQRAYPVGTAQPAMRRCTQWARSYGTAPRKQKTRYLPGISSGEIRLQAFSITEVSGSDTSRIETVAERDGDDDLITGHKTWTSRIAESDLVIVLARTSPRDQRPTEGMTLFLVDLRDVRAHHPEQVEVIPVRTMFNYATNQVKYHGLRVPVDAVLGEVGHGFRHVIDGWNAEGTLLAAEAIGDARWFVERAVSYSQNREVFGRPIAVNQGIQFPLADAYMRTRSGGRRARGSTPASPAAPRPTWPNGWRPRPAGRPPTCAWTPTEVSASSTPTTWSASSVRPGCMAWHRSAAT